MNPPLPERKPIRLPEFDYSSNGAYFVTICTQDRIARFGRVCRGDPCGRPPVAPFVKLSEFGAIAEEVIAFIEKSYCDVRIPIFQIMPDHVHMIVTLERATARVAPTLGRVIGAYKSKVAYQCLNLCKQKNQQMGPLWQRGYYEHVIRNEADYLECARYIQNNPAAWTEKNSENRESAV